MIIPNDTILFEKRENPRIPLEVQVAMNTLQKGPRVFGWMQDISQGGFKVKIDIPLSFKSFFQEGREVSFETFEDFFQLKGRGGIIWTSSDGEIAGVRFDQLGEESRRILDEFLVCFGRDVPPPPLSPIVEIHV